MLVVSFPGEFTGASLKPEERPRLVAHRGAFPGEFTGASLKLAQLLQGHLQLVPFPGEFTGASLKPPETGRAKCLNLFPR